MSTITIGTCDRCGYEGAIFADNKFCEDCDSNTITCSICNTLQSSSGHCRHVFRNEDFEWCGSGAYSGPSLKEPLFNLFALMPSGFVQDLRQAISSGEFYTWLMAPLIGGGGLLELHGMPQRDGLPRSPLFYWGDKLLEIGEGEDAEETADGYHWLVSLYKDDTSEANQQTIAWIDEYIARAGQAGEQYA